VRISTTPAFHSLTSICGGRVVGGRCGFKHLLGILADGRVSFCGMGYRAREYVFMQAGDASLEEVWNDDPQLQHVRRLLPERLEGVCANCVARSACQGGCRAEAYEIYGSLTAPSPACQQLYDAGLFPIQRLVSPDRDSHYERPSPSHASTRLPMLQAV
jgi:radical SAM protein with 4Fe4S-binding SPASM domain